jgi:hypothetical protein
VTTEDEYFALFPNPSNLTAPNLMLLKFKLIGLPGSLAIVYLMMTLAIGITGAVGLRRCLAMSS